MFPGHGEHGVRWQTKASLGLKKSREGRDWGKVLPYSVSGAFSWKIKVRYLFICLSRANVNFFLTKAAWIWPQLGFVGMIKEAKEEFFLQTLFYTRTADFQYDTPVTAKCTVLLTYALSLISSFYWVAACSRLRIGNTAELWPVSSQTPAICMRSGDSSSEKVDRPPRYEPICHWRGSIYRLGVRSEETDKGSESGRRRLIDWRQIHPLSASLPLHESVKPPLSCT